MNKLKNIPTPTFIQISKRDNGDESKAYPDFRIYDLVLSVRSVRSKRIYLFPVTLTTILTVLVVVLLLIVICLQIIGLTR